MDRGRVRRTMRFGVERTLRSQGAAGVAGSTGRTSPGAIWSWRSGPDVRRRSGATRRSRVMSRCGIRPSL